MAYLGPVQCEDCLCTHMIHTTPQAHPKITFPSRVPERESSQPVEGAGYTALGGQTLSGLKTCSCLDTQGH